MTDFTSDTVVLRVNDNSNKSQFGNERAAALIAINQHTT